LDWQGNCLSGLVFLLPTPYMVVMNTLSITGMTCNGCRNKVEATLRNLLPDVAVTLDPPQAVTSASVDEASLNAALSQVGKYRVNGLALKRAAPSWIKTYSPLFLVLGLIGLAALAAQDWMMAAMGGFYIVFGAFKLLDVPAFANAYGRYDVIAKQFKPWGYMYPFVEVALGFAFLFHFHMMAATWVALVLSVIGAVGVIQANLSKQTIQCACLGTVFQLPMSVVTVVENLGMAVMAAWMIWISF
jgi:copper chaperone CopZ